MSLVKTGLISSVDQKVDQKKWDENYIRIFGHSGPNITQADKKGVVRDKSSTLDNKDSSISRMLNDKVMVRMIRGGKANDPGLKREAERIERENSTRPKVLYRERKQAELRQAITDLRRSQRQ